MAKRIFVLLAFLLALSVSPALAQEAEPADQAVAQDTFGAQLTGALGITTIDGELYYRVQLMPEFAFYKMGLGLDVDLLFNDDGLRKEDWEPKSRWVRIIRYARWGHKHDVFYIRLGALDAATLGHGSIMYRYANQVNDADRKVGMELDPDFGMAGFESVISNFGRAEIYGGRGYVRPLKSSEMFIIKNFEVGASLVTDFDPDQRTATDDGVTALGFDLGLPLIKTSLLYTQVYYDFAKIKDYGSGNVVGLATDFNFPGEVLKLSAKLEERFLGAHYLPQYFDRFYEVERCQMLDTIAIRKTDALERLDESRNGTYGELAADLAGRLTVLGSYQAIHKVPYSGVLHFETDLSKVMPKVEIRAAYDQKNINSTQNLFTKNENTLVTVEGGYQIYPHVMLYLTYLRTYERIVDDKDADGNTISPYYRSVEKFSPRLAVKFSF